MNREEHRDRLIELRDRLERALDDADPNMLPQLAGQYRATLEDLAKLDAQEPRPAIHDDLREKRAQRRQSQRSA